VIETAQGDISAQISGSLSNNLDLSTSLTRSSAFGDAPEEDDESTATCSEAGDEVCCATSSEQRQLAFVSEGECHAAVHANDPNQAPTRFCTTGPSQSLEEVTASGTLGHDVEAASGGASPLQPRLTSVLMELPRHIDESETGAAEPFSPRLTGIPAHKASDSVHSGLSLPPAA